MENCSMHCITQPRKAKAVVVVVVEKRKIVEKRG
jgi:hypothetical protein